MLSYPVYNSKNINSIFVFSLIFTTLLLSSGLFINSFSIIAIALFDLLNTLNIAIQLFLKLFFKKTHEDTFTYGYKRFHLIASIILSVIFICTLILLLNQIIINFSLKYTLSPLWVLIIAILGIIFRVIILFIYKKHEKSSVDYINHILGWFSILVLSIILMFFKIAILDKFLSIAIIVWLFFILSKNILNHIIILLQKVPDNFNIPDFKKEILLIYNVKRINEIHVWSIDGFDNVLTMKLSITFNNIYDFKKVKNEINKICESKGISNTTIEFVD
ncbi:cation transporter [Methanobrevibacter filiformis]|uniref:Cobalt-zinc-cadmium resistance protein CzcD n=1 Tax=Methanobrevibacter filiformis TaxID=55758 RepID=A0A166ES53_9EURY|nr:cation transporter [Methanobrevibacter filiformis]KZX16950.1 cobalt-zinc-cadmium resistance protein CzcD [Methanobrevibacter filiformis]